MSEKMTTADVLDQLMEITTRAVEAAQGRGCMETVQKDFDALDAALTPIFGTNPARPKGEA